MDKRIVIVIVFILFASPFVSMTQVGSTDVGVVGNWTFDEGSGNIAHDSSINGNDGTIYGAQWVSGISGSALRFRDSSTYVTADFPNGLEGNTEFTVSFWIKIDQWPSAQYAYLIMFGPGGDWNYDRSFHVLLDNDPGFAPYGTVRANFWCRVVPTSNTFLTGVWYNWVFVYDKSNVKMYQNGTFLEAISLGGASPNLDPNGFLTFSTPWSQSFEGILDEVSFFNYAKTDNEIQNDYYAFAHPVIESTITLEPETLNLASNGKWITGYIELPEGYNIADINPSTIRINNEVAIDPAFTPVIGDHDSDGIADLTIKFRRSSVTSLLGSASNTANLIISGNVAETTFSSTCTLKIIRK